MNFRALLYSLFPMSFIHLFLYVAFIAFAIISTDFNRLTASWGILIFAAIIIFLCHIEPLLSFSAFLESPKSNRLCLYPAFLHILDSEIYHLWEKPVIVCITDGENGSEIHDIQYQKVENG